MMPALDGLTGIVLIAIFGSVFVITCIISAIKAVRDRARIKKRIAVREKEKLENGFVDEERCSRTENISSSSQYSSKSCKPTYSGNNRLSNGTSCSSGSVEHLDLSVYSISTGVDNLIFQHSYANIAYADENCRVSPQKSKTVAEIVPPCQITVPKRVKSFQKIMRRHSYDIAVCEHSWLSQEIPCVSPSQPIVDTLNSKENVETNTKYLKADFENIAYDKGDDLQT
ncbi:uncharacterized protein LOC123545313 [Mercenaria mercenaria]|uniref:uncharacterized protein LOC123545313 n=1 Tax=Mercenaria mercenaria TaxID=6596 RepID=UPI00234F973B|nr:uncharacterized protein LOC123545313 [Mercenaria mercenaria]